jgi:hypothetical protein
MEEAFGVFQVVLMLADQAEVVEDAGDERAVGVVGLDADAQRFAQRFSALSRWPRWNSEEPIVARSLARAADWSFNSFVMRLAASGSSRTFDEGPG